VTGSLAFGALARVVLATGKIDDGGTMKRIFCRAKSNIGPDDGGFEYDFVQAELADHPGIFASSILWGNAVEGTARELLAEPDNRETGEHDTSALDDAKEFLQELLTDGELPQKQIQIDAKGASHSWATVRRAKTDLSIKSIKTKLDGWVWKLPSNMLKSSEDAQGAHINNVSILSALPESKPTQENAPTENDETEVAYSTQTGQSVHGKVDSRRVATRGLFFTPDPWVWSNHFYAFASTRRSG